jgi:hypothetical protein
MIIANDMRRDQERRIQADVTPTVMTMQVSMAEELQVHK